MGRAGVGIVLVVLAAGGMTTDAVARAAVPTGTPAQEQSRPDRNAPAFKEFSKRIAAYAALHDRLESTLPKLPREATPEQIDTHQRALGGLIREERKTAKRGDIFTAESVDAIRRLLRDVFGGAEGRQLKASIMDENPVDAPVSVNSRYPDEVPLSTVPPQVLAALPKLPETLEYRFVGDRLILLDVHAHLVVDYIDDALPV